MPRISVIGPGTPVGKRILEDFKNWKTTGFKPFGKSVGGVDHYKSCSEYQCVSANSFRSQAQKIAKIALEQMPACDFEDDSEDIIPESGKGNTEPKANRNAAGDDDKSLPLDSEKRNPWMRYEAIEEDSSESDDSESNRFDEESCVSDVIEQSKIQNLRSPFLSQYPTGDKLLAIFPLDGNVLDNDANQFEFVENNTAIHRWGKVPKERESCVALIGLGTEKPSKLGFSEVDLMVVDAVIQKRLKANNYKRDENGNIWEIRATLQLPFKCHPKLYGKNGKILTSFRMLSNGQGFSWGYFWLLAWNPPKSKAGKRIGGQLVKVIPKDDSSIYTEKTYESKNQK